MKKMGFLLATAFCVLIMSSSVFGQLLIEDFNYTAATALTANGWVAHSAGGTNPITVVTPGLVYPGYPSSAIGNAVSMTTSGEDDNKTFASQTFGSVYAAFMVNVSATQATGDYFFSVFQTSSILVGRVFAKKDPSSTNYALGIARNSAVPNYTGFSYAPNTTHLIVVKYTFVAGLTNDTVDLFIDPVIGGVEPAPTISATDVTATDATALVAVALRQGAAGSASTQQVDGIRVGTSWASATSILVSLPHVTGPIGSTISVPITVGDLTGQGVKAYDLQVSFNAAIVQPDVTPTDTAGTLSSTMLITPNATNPGHLIVSAFQATDLSGSGTLIKLRFTIVGAPGQVTATQFQDYIDPGTIFHPGFRFNAGTPLASTTNGSIHVNGPTAANGTVSGRITDEQGQPVSGTVVRLNGAQSRKTITDANGNYYFDNVETNGFYTVTPSRANFTFSPGERSFSQIGNSTEAAFTGSPVAGGNPLDTPEYFVRQHYLDFLSREPDESGFNFWSDQILECGNDADCIERRTVNVSAAYFLSVEFQRTGGLVDRLYRASYGRSPLYAEFMPDRATIARGVVVGRRGWQQLLAANEESFVDRWAGRAAFHTAFDSLSHDSYVDTLLSNTGVRFTQSERDALLRGLNAGSLSRAEVLQQIANNDNFARARFNEAFVMMEYFGYLGRDPDPSGYAFWLNKLNEFNGNFERAEMVKAFIDSGEYRARFVR